MAGNYRRYPWAEWLTATQVELRRGRDFDGRVDTMIQQARNQASRWGMRISITPDEDGQGFSVQVLGLKQ